jgi:hypothetical protein
MTPRSRSFRLGDILEIATDSGLVYVHFVRRDPLGIPVVRVFDKSFQKRPEDLRQLLGLRPRFLAMAMSLDSPRFTVVGNMPPPEDARLPVILLFPMFQRRDLPPKWRLWDGERVWDADSPEHDGREAPKAQSLSPGYLVHAIEKGFRLPEEGWLTESPDEGTSTTAAPATAPRLGGQVLHLVKYPSRGSAETAAGRIECAQATVRERNDPEEWILEISRPAADVTEIEAQAQQIEAIAQATGGDYEGWESTVLGSAVTRDN